MAAEYQALTGDKPNRYTHSFQREGGASVSQVLELHCSLWRPSQRPSFPSWCYPSAVSALFQPSRKLGWVFSQALQPNKLLAPSQRVGAELQAFRAVDCAPAVQILLPTLWKVLFLEQDLGLRFQWPHPSFPYCPVWAFVKEHEMSPKSRENSEQGALIFLVVSPTVRGSHRRWSLELTRHLLRR